MDRCLLGPTDRGGPPLSFTYGGKPSSELLARWACQRDQEKLDEYLDSVRAVERRIAAIEHRQQEAALEQAGHRRSALEIVGDLRGDPEPARGAGITGHG